MKKLNKVLLATAVGALSFAMASCAEQPEYGATTAPVIPAQHEQTMPGAPTDRIADNVRIINTYSFNKVKQVIDGKNRHYNAPNVLVVFDVDDTLLKPTTDLGSEIWYKWQTNQLKLRPRNKAERVSCLHQDSIHMLYDLLPSTLTEKSIPSIIRSFQKKKQPMFALSDREAASRYATARELRRNGINFGKTALTYPGQVKPPVFQDTFKRKVTYIDGVFMAARENKGKMLDYVLNKTNNHFKSIVFVDDNLKNIMNVQRILSAPKYADVDVSVVYYTKVEHDRIAKHKEILTTKQAADMTKKWNKLIKLINELYPARKPICLGFEE